MSTDVSTLNLSENSDGMVALNNNMSTNFIEKGQQPIIEPPNIVSEKNKANFFTYFHFFNFYIYC